MQTIEHGLGNRGPGAMRTGLSAVRCFHLQTLYCHPK